MQEPKKSKDMYVTQQNLNHSYQALMNEILNLGESMKLGFESVKTELRQEMYEIMTELRDEIKTLGEDLRGEMKVMGEDLRCEMRVMGEGLSGEMKAMGEDLRGEMRGMSEDLRGKMSAMGVDLKKETRGLRGDLNKLALDFQDSRAFYTKELGDIKVQNQKTLAKVEEVHTIALYALDGYRTLWDKTNKHEQRLDNFDDFIGQF